MPPARQPRCIAPGCPEAPLQGRVHCETHHQRRRETWKAGGKDYRDRQRARTRQMEDWATLLHDVVIPACNEVYDQNDKAMDAAELLRKAIENRDASKALAAFDSLADALEATRTAVVGSNRQIQELQRRTGPLALILDPPPRPRERRATRLAREEELPA